MNTRNLNHNLVEVTLDIKCGPSHEVFESLYIQGQPALLFESKDVSPVYGRLSMIGVDPIMKITGKDERFVIEQLAEPYLSAGRRGAPFFEKFINEDFAFCDSLERKKNQIVGKVKIKRDNLEETQRSLQNNITQAIRVFLKKFEQNERILLGLYGAFSYDCIRLFEEIGSSQPQNNVNDFTLFLYDTFVFFDHLKGRSEIVVFRHDENTAKSDALSLKDRILNPHSNTNAKDLKISNVAFELVQDEYEELVDLGREQAKIGELFEVVFSNILKAKVSGNPFELYKIYRKKNPSPYLFFFDAGEEQLVGASPEMMVRVEDGIAHMRPISGTARRGADPIEDHENMMSLLSSSKEKAELDMLIDLGRNDLSRVCVSGVNITDYRFVEKYSRVMHTVAHVSGVLRNGYTALDALIACMNAGTLTGAPKVAAMRLIESNEKERRGYYGGSIGYLTFSGEMDTGIIIRTAHIRDGRLRFQVGATLLYDSVPALEYQETINKAQAFLDCL